MASVAFLIPMYQSAATIQSCLDSIVKQTEARFEAIVVDDGSTDAGPDIVEHVARKDPRIRLVRSASNRGVASSLNLGLANTDAELIARLDADDEASPRRLERQMELMSAEPDTALCGSFVKHMGILPEYDRLGRVPVEDHAIKHALHVQGTNPFYHPSVMFRRAVVMDLGGYREFFRHAEDRDLWLRISRNNKMHNIPKPLTRYRINLSGASVRKMWDQRRDARVAMESFHRPEMALDDLLQEVPPAGAGDERKVFLEKSYSYLVEELLRLGRTREATHLLARSIGDVSWSFAGSLAYLQLIQWYRGKFSR